MKIFLDCTFLRNKLTGVDVTFLSLINEISTLDKENLYSIYIDSRFNETILKENLNNNKNFKVKKLYSPLPLQILYSSFIFPLILLIGKFDVYHNPYFFGPIFKFFNKKTKIIITVHDLYYITIPNYVNKKIKFAFKLFAERAIKKADNLIAISSQTKKDLIEYLKIDEAKIKLIYQSLNSRLNNVSTDNTIFSRIKIPTNGLFFLNIGKVIQSKGLLDLVKAFYEVSKKNNNYYLIQVGLICDKKLFQEISDFIVKNNIADKVYFLGYLEDEKVKALYANAYSVVISSYNEGFGLPALEAFYFNKPLISRNIGAIGEIAGDAALYFNTIDELISCIFLLEKNHEIKDSLILKGKDRLQFFSWQESAKKVIQLYHYELYN